MNVLSIETSCDETAAAIIEGGRTVLANVVWSQLGTHERFGGVVPELAARAHTAAIVPVVREAMQTSGLGWSDVDAIAVTNRPGLSGALLVGVNAAKAMAFARKLPLIGVHHIEGHIAANWLISDLQHFDEIALPAVCLIVSGGHTDLILMNAPGSYSLLGTTLDDAAGEAFDKGARLLELGYPGGPAIQKAAAHGDPDAIPFPRAWLDGSFDFSFSGLKTSLLRLVEPYRTSRARSENTGGGAFAEHVPAVFREDTPVHDLAAGYQQAIVDVLVRKTIAAAVSRHVKTVLVAGGVAANRQLHEQMRIAAREANPDMRVISPTIAYCTDNAAMIGAAGYWALTRGERSGNELDVISREALAGRN